MAAMTSVNETKLPGVGMRHDFATANGDQVGVISHHSGRRELVIYDPVDPDRVRACANLDAAETALLAELLGGATVVERLADLRQHIAGLAIDWLPLSAGSAFAGRRLGDTEMRSRTGVSIVAVLRGDAAIPAPGPDTVLHAGDTVVVVGTAEGIDAAVALLTTAG
jgi:TrkA domain protein